jgi:hypothetical protein
MRTSESRDSTSSVDVPNVELLVESRGEGFGCVDVVTVLNAPGEKGTMSRHAAKIFVRKIFNL